MSSIPDVRSDAAAPSLWVGLSGWIRAHARMLRMMSQLVILVAAVWFLVVPQLRGSSHSLHLLLNVDNSWLPLALVSELASLLFYTLATRSMLAQRSRPSLQRVIRVDLSAIALGHCLPDGGAAGTALGWRLLVRAGVPSADAAFAKLAQGLGSAVVLQTLLLAAYITGAALGGFTRWSLVPAAAAALILVGFAVVASCIRHRDFRQRLGNALCGIPHWGAMASSWLSRAYDRHIVQQLGSAVGDRRRFALAAGWATANWLFDAGALWLSLHAYGDAVGLEALAVAFGVANTLTWLPITPSGLGLSEGLMIPVLIAFGSTRSTAVLGILTWRLLAYWLPIPLGAIAYGTLHWRPRRA